MLAVNLVGFKKSGKTGLALDLAAEFKRRGIRAAAAKHTHHPVLDRGQTDSDRLFAAFGQCVALAGSEAQIRWDSKRYLLDLTPLLDCEVLVVEGGKPLGWLPRIILPRTPEEAEALSPELALGSFGPVEVPGLPRLADPAAVADLVLARGFMLPGLDCASCGRPDCRALAADIVAGRAEVRDCRARRADIRVTVAGNELALSPFVADILAGGILGMLSTLKGHAPGPVEISITG
ncbi:MAG: molybdopterin-guanine dinucleotide biosynthesis protein MobB [Thermodesulfobacteriota bacterium]